MFFSTFCRGLAAFSLFAAAGRPAVKNKARKCRDISQGKQHGQNGFVTTSALWIFPKMIPALAWPWQLMHTAGFDSIRAVIDGVKVAVGAGLCGILTAQVHLAVALAHAWQSERQGS